jgi:hypothetical protein
MNLPGFNRALTRTGCIGAFLLPGFVALTLTCANDNASSGKADAGSRGCQGGACDAQPGVDDARGGDASEADGGGPVQQDNPLCPRSGGSIVTDSGPLPHGLQVVPGSLPGASYFALTDSYVYWGSDQSHNHAIHRVALGDGSDITLLDRSSLDDHLQGIAVDSTALYLLEGGISRPLGLAKMPIDGSSAPTTLVSLNSVWDLGIGGGYIYYYDVNQAAIARISTAGGTPTVLIRNVDPVGMTLANGYVYFVHPHANSSVYHVFRVPVTAQAPDLDAGLAGAGDASAADADGGSLLPGAEVIAATGPFGASPVADSTNLYWGDHSNLMMVPLAGGMPVMIGQAPQDDIIDEIATSGSAVYWRESPFIGNCSSINKTSTSGWQTTVLVPRIAAGLVGVNSSSVILVGGQLLRLPL